MTFVTTTSGIRLIPSPSASHQTSGMKTYSFEPGPTMLSPTLAWALVGEPLERFIAQVSAIVDQAMEHPRVVSIEPHLLSDRKTA